VKHPDMNKPKVPKTADKRGAKKPEAFDLWLTRGLHQIYDEVAKEPIPEDLLRLIEEDRDK
jgi:hypothetical protein